MNFQQFVNAVEKSLNQKLEGGAKASCHTTVKNNGTEKTGVIIEAPGINLSPAIYLEEYYEDYKKGRSVEQAAEALMKFYRSIRMEKDWDYGSVFEYSQIKDKILFRLVNTEKNEGFLCSVPNRGYLNLSVVYYILLEMNEEGTAAMPVKNIHMEKWGVTEEELWEAAVKNGRRLLPAEFITMRHALYEYMGGEDAQQYSGNLLEAPAQEKDQMYVLSNNIRSYGAACIIYPYVLEMIGEILEDDFYVLPSSVHEVVIVPAACGIVSGDIDEMVREINETQVAAEEVLSDASYFYSRSSGTLQLGALL